MEDEPEAGPEDGDKAGGDPPSGDGQTPEQAAKAPAAKATKRAVVRPRKASRAAKKSAKKAASRPTQQARFPRHSVEKALRIPKALYDQNGGQPATRAEAARFAGAQSLSGPLNTEISSSLKYGFLQADGSSTVALTDRARAAIAPQGETDRVNALREAILDAPEISDVYSFYRGESLPDAKFLVNALVDRFHIPADKVAEFQVVFEESIRAADLLDESGPRPRLIDIGVDDEHRSHRAKPVDASGARLPAGTTCFVMQPFAGALGGYYETIFKPAIQQAGLEPMRADAEIFGTGKIIDQIWRGINGAGVLVAELTSKNPNVFYELGLAHALRKPVVLVSSNEDDVPFDLRHIRVIIYDQSDPFWGQKLVDKIADNIVSAIRNPEEAIFRVDGSGE